MAKVRAKVVMDVVEEPLRSAAEVRRLQAMDRVKGLARRTFNKHVLSEIGGCNGLFALDAERFPDPVLVASTDGVGGKLQLGARLGVHASVAADVVNHCVNDVAVQGATPLFFLDYLSTGELDTDIVQQVIGGLVDACRANGCALLGGETSENPALFPRGGDYELAGFLTGVVSRKRMISGEAVREGDCLLAMPSNGLHSSGYALAYELLFEKAGYAPGQYLNELGDKVGAALLRPHRSYLAPIRKLIQAEVVSGLVHVTGGGLSESLPRVMPRGLAAQVERGAWEVPAVFNHLQQLGGLDDETMLRSFNMGVGLVAVVPAELVKKAKMVLTRMNERSMVVGRVVKRAVGRVGYV